MGGQQDLIRLLDDLDARLRPAGRVISNMLSVNMAVWMERAQAGERIPAGEVEDVLRIWAPGLWVEQLKGSMTFILDGMTEGRFA